jgi:hypothetical protein
MEKTSEPFWLFENKHITFALTSNVRFDFKRWLDGKELYKHVLETSKPGRTVRT